VVSTKGDDASRTTGQIYHSIISFVMLQIIGLGLVMTFPTLVTWLPSMMIGEVAPTW